MYDCSSGCGYSWACSATRISIHILLHGRGQQGYCHGNHGASMFVTELQPHGGTFNILGRCTWQGHPLPHPHRLAVTDVVSQSRGKCTVRCSCAWVWYEVEGFSSPEEQANICPWEQWRDSFPTFKTSCILETASANGHLFCHAATSRSHCSGVEVKPSQQKWGTEQDFLQEDTSLQPY